MDFLTLEQSVWSRLKEETRPIVLYGMGDGADKILAQFDRLGIRASGDSRAMNLRAAICFTAFRCASCRTRRRSLARTS